MRTTTTRRRVEGRARGFGEGPMARPLRAKVGVDGCCRGCETALCRGRRRRARRRPYRCVRCGCESNTKGGRPRRLLPTSSNDTAAAATTESAETRAKRGETGASPKPPPLPQKIEGTLRNTRTIVETGYWFEDGRPVAHRTQRAMGRKGCRVPRMMYVRCDGGLYASCRV